MCNNLQAFYELVRAGLWEKEAQLLKFGKVDYEEIMRLAEEQSVVGLVTVGLEHVKDVKVPQEELLQFIGQSLQIVQQNTAMNQFLGELVGKMRVAGIYTLLVKGQGVAQCYERPLWRSCGDVDLFLSEEDYEKAKQYLTPLATHVEPENRVKKHIGLTIEPWVVELHGSLRGSLSRRINKVLDEILKDTFYEGSVRSWTNGNTQIFLLSSDNDVLYVFSHFLFHFYTGGIGLRQICDWCRLLWTYRSTINIQLLESRIHRMRLMTEWKAFGAFAVIYLGMPSEAMPFYSPDKKWKRKANRIKDFILMSGNFGLNRDMSYYNKYPYLVRKVISLGNRCGDLIRHSRIFPLDSLRFFPYMMLNGLREALRWK